MKVLLAYLPPPEESHDYYMSLLPYGLTALAVVTEKAGCDVTLANFSRKGRKGALKILRNEKFDLIGFSLFSYNRNETLKLIRRIKKDMPRCRIVVGGHHATTLSGEILKRYPEIDHIICGEGEEAWLSLVDDLQKGKSPERLIDGIRIKNLDALPFPAAFRGKTIDINPHEQYKVLISTRGCPHHCSFCASPEFWKRRVTFRSAESLADEVEYLHRKLGIIYFSLRDDNFTLKKGRVIAFSRLLRQRGLYLMWNCQSRVDTIDEEMLREMKLGGLEHIQYGVESGSERILAELDKDIRLDDVRAAAAATRRLGIYLSIYLMAGLEGETIRDIKATEKLIREILPGDGMVSPVAYFPGTELYKKAKQGGKLKDSDWFSRKDTGLYVRTDDEARNMVMLLVNQLGKIRQRSWYRETDFIHHHEAMGPDCWVTDILEGDYFLDEEFFDEAEDAYRQVMEKYPENIWGYIRMGKSRFLQEDYIESEKWYSRAIETGVPYYGIWLKLAEVYVCLERRRDAVAALKEARRLNRFDPRIKNLGRLLSS